MLQKRGATRGRAMGAVHKGSDAKPRANRRAAREGRLLGAKHGREGGVTGRGRRNGNWWGEEEEGNVAEVCEMGRCVCTAGGRLVGCTRVCVCGVCGTGVEQSAVARSSLGKVRCQQQQEHLEHCLQPEQCQDGSSVGRSCTVSTPDQ